MPDIGTQSEYWDGGFLVNAFGGNTFSGITNLVSTLASPNSTSEQVLTQLGRADLRGPLQGVPARLVGLSQSPARFVDFGWGGDPRPEVAPKNGGKSKTKSAPQKDIHKTWSRTLSCNGTAEQLMAQIQNNMNSFAGDRGFLSAADFPTQPLRLGSTYNVFPGLNLHAPGGSEVPVTDLRVRVTSQSSSGWTFTTDPAHHFFDGTVHFQAVAAGAGSVNFSITANANVSSQLLKYTLGFLIKSGEENTWNSMLDTVQNACQAFTF